MFIEEIKELVIDSLIDKNYFKVYFGNYPLKGISGNLWSPDVVIVNTLFNNSEELNYGVRLITEIKMQNYDFNKGNKPKSHTWKEHVWRAYARFGDMKNWEVPKYVLFPYIENRRNFDCFSYFDSIDVVLLD
jgi:hypothetical protein